MRSPTIWRHGPPAGPGIELVDRISDAIEDAKVVANDLLDLDYDGDV